MSSIARLGEVDWNFAGSTIDPNSVHSLHWFPGNFIPQIPSYLIQALSRTGDVILDPFGGTGTTGIEALLLNRRAWMSDLSRASAQVMRGKLRLLSQPDAVDQLAEVLRGLTWDLVIGTDRPGACGEGSDPELLSWYAPDTLYQLKGVWKLIEESEAIRPTLEMLFADTLFACASTGGAPTKSGKRRRHHWGWIADNVKPTRPKLHDAVKVFRERVLRAIQVARANPRISASACRIEVADARRLPFPDASTDVIVTSPPYVNMIDYTMASRLTYLWMGWPIHDEREEEIGARFKRRRKGVGSEYERAMEEAWSEMKRVVKPGGAIAMVIGSSRTHKGYAAELLGRWQEDVRLVAGPFSRTPTRRRVSEREGTEPSELIAVFRR
jgi:SAM-dependent methyltransferase